jgi:serine phosphatase RsbU (regulator of sigma subunit)
MMRQGRKIVSGDCRCGRKSIPAALLMATFQASLHTIARHGVPLEELVLRLNRYACAHSLDGMRFTTAVLGEYDPVTNRLSYVNAGHNAPVIRRQHASANSGIERLEVGGMPFGISLQAKYETGVVDLAPEDALILFTDGVVEAFNQKGEEFTDARWIAAIRNLPDMDAQRSLQFRCSAWMNSWAPRGNPTILPAWFCAANSGFFDSFDKRIIS